MPHEELQIRQTEDGSHTLFVPTFGEAYHSLYGAVSESLHVFINSGLHKIAGEKNMVHILEAGLGTGLNLLLTWTESRRMNISVDYTALEAYPLETGLACRLNYPEVIGEQGLREVFDTLHASQWGARFMLGDHFSVTKLRTKIEEYQASGEMFDLVYYDAFSPDIQEELWTAEIFKKMALLLSPGGVLVTYSAKGQVRRNLQQAGFSTERLPGPRGKREMLRAVKTTID